MKITKQTPREKVIAVAAECRKCGHCCSFGGCFVLEDETERLAQKLNISRNEFKEKYLDENRLFNKIVHKTKVVKKEEELPFGNCVFLSANDKTCSLHEVKPLHCRIGTCNEHGNDTIEWFFLNHVVDPDDPVSVREWAVRLKTKATIPGGNPEDLVEDAEKLKKILDYSITGFEKEYDDLKDLDEWKNEFDEAVNTALENAMDECMNDKRHNKKNGRKNKKN
ncbi:MAG: YkgJ family cysteine cluster protein [Nanoarchaeota archaeon]|nr:YkgJ family cysteine cluster protein [Nanoarchaeota archaeon]